MLVVWNGTRRVAIWYRMQPAAQISAFSVYGSLRTSSGLERAMDILLIRLCSITTIAIPIRDYYRSFWL